MAMNATLSNLISEASQKSRQFLAEYGALMVLDVQYANHSAEITQEEIDSVPSFAAAGLTPEDVAAAIYILKMIKVQMDSNIDAIVKVAKL